MAEDTVSGPVVRRMDLDASGWAQAVRVLGFALPPGFPIPEGGVPDASVPDAPISADVPDGDAAGAGEVSADPVRDRSARDGLLVAASAVLSTLQVRVQVSVGAADGRGLVALLGLSGPVGAGLITRPEGGVQLSVFPAASLAAELIRVVPAASDLTGEDERIVRGLDGTASTTPPSGVVPLAALTELPVVSAVLGTAVAATHPPLASGQADLVTQLVRGTRGVLHALVSGPIRAHGQPGTGLAQAVWFGTAAGWVAGEPIPGTAGERLVRLRPVAREDLPAALAPAITQLLIHQAARSADGAADDDRG
jgi:hypothetical protein